MTWIATVISVVIFEYSSSYIYRLLPEGEWEVGQTKCEHVGMEFATIKDNASMEEILDFLSIYHSSNDSVEVWIGLFWDTDRDAFYWSDGDQLGPYTFWDAGNNEPNHMEQFLGFFSQNCVRIAMPYWRTKECRMDFPILCMGLPDLGTVSTAISSWTEGRTPFLSTTRITGPNNLTLNPTSSSTPNTTTATPSPTSAITSKTTTTIPICQCNCSITREPIVVKEEEFKRLLELLKVDKKDTNAYKRKIMSVKDNRTSSRVIGYLGVLLITVALLLIMLGDITRFLQMNQVLT